MIVADFRISIHIFYRNVLSHCLTNGVERSTFLSTIIIAYELRGVVHHELIPVQETPWIITLTEHNHFVCNLQQPVISLLVIEVETTGLSLEGNCSYQCDVGIATFQRNDRFCRHHIKPNGKAGYEISDAMPISIKHSI